MTAPWYQRNDHPSSFFVTIWKWPLILMMSSWTTAILKYWITFLNLAVIMITITFLAYFVRKSFITASEGHHPGSWRALEDFKRIKAPLKGRKSKLESKLIVQWTYLFVTKTELESLDECFGNISKKQNLPGNTGIELETQINLEKLLLIWKHRYYLKNCTSIF